MGKHFGEEVTASADRALAAFVAVDQRCAFFATLLPTMIKPARVRE
jgi:hypothetical protein